MYQGYLIAVGSYTIPHKFIKAESYNVVRHVNDVDSYRNASGELVRNVINHLGYEVTFETPPLMTNTQVKELMTGIKNNYSVAKERKVSAKVYIPEIDDYKTFDMYLADPQFNIYGIFGGTIKYQSIKFEFTSY